MVGKHVAVFQQELSLAKVMRRATEESAPMPYGDPLRVWYPHHVCQSPCVKRPTPRERGRLSNGVPTLLRLRLAGDYVLGLYNPEH